MWEIVTARPTRHSRTQPELHKSLKVLIFFFFIYTYIDIYMCVCVSEFFHAFWRLFFLTTFSSVFPSGQDRVRQDRNGCVNDMLILLQCYACFNAKIPLHNTMVAPYSDMESDGKLLFPSKGTFLSVHSLSYEEMQGSIICSGLAQQERRCFLFFCCCITAKMLPKYTWRPLASRKKLSRVGHAGLTLHFIRLSLEQNKWNKTCGSSRGSPSNSVQSLCKIIIIDN